MNYSKTTVATVMASLLLTSGLGMANNIPKALIEKSAQTKTLTGAIDITNSTRGKTWHYGDVNDNVIFSSNISIANRSGEIVYTSTEFYGMNILDNDYLLPNEVIDNITTNFQFSAVHLTLRDSHHDIFFDGNVFPNTHFTIKPVDTYITLGARSATINGKLELVQK